MNMRKYFKLKWFGIAIMALALTVLGVSCGSDDTGADPSAEIQNLDDDELEQWWIDYFKNKE